MDDHDAGIAAGIFITEGGRAIFRSVIDQDYLEVLIALVHDGLNAVGQESLGVVDGDYDGNERCIIGLHFAAKSIEMRTCHADSTIDGKREEQSNACGYSPLDRGYALLSLSTNYQKTILTFA